MAQQADTVQNNFKEGLKTEFTGLNFPPNAATDTQNCVFSYIGDVSRRGGINYEENFNNNSINVAGVARSSFRWLNAGGDGESQILVVQIGTILYFYLTSAATTASPISANLISQTVNLGTYQAQGNTASIFLTECQYASGNGYLFVFHPDCDPLYCTYTPAVANVSAPVITANPITLQIRDTIGIPEPNTPDNFRPGTLSNEHLYNLLNQGWTQGTGGWTGTSSFFSGGLPLSNVNSNPNFNLQLNTQSNTTSIVLGDEISVVFSQCAGTGSNPHNNGTVTINATVTSYNGAGGAIGLSAISNSNPALNATGAWNSGTFAQFPSPCNLTLANVGFISTWFTDLGNYPSNADIWWLYKNTNDIFQPVPTAVSVQPSQTAAPKGAFVMNPFVQNRSASSSIGGLTPVQTVFRPSTGAFYQGRVFYAGINASQFATGDEPFTTWTENIYFSQIVESTVNFGRCYQTNDPTSQTLFGLLPSDGGVLQIQGCGAIYKLFPLRFGLLVFAANGIWFIGGSSGIGFSATDFSVTKISNIQAISGTSFIEVQGYPFFWNQEGIYEVVPSQQAGSAHSPDIQLSVNNLALGTILSYYNNIPQISKLFSRGDYDMINYIVQWCYRSTPETPNSQLIDRYSYDTILNYNTITKAFYPYTIPVGVTTFVSGGFTISAPIVSDIKYIQNPGGANQGPNLIGNVPTGPFPLPVFKYITQTPFQGGLTFSEENDFTNYIDFISANTGGHKDYTSYFVTGYMLPGQALRKIQIPILYMFSRNPDGSKCSIQAIWDFVNNPGTGKESTRQVITMTPNSLYRKVRLRGRGMAVQIKVSSISGQPFDLMGWSVLDQINQVV